MRTGGELWYDYHKDEVVVVEDLDWDKRCYRGLIEGICTLAGVSAVPVNFHLADAQGRKTP